MAVIVMAGTMAWVAAMVPGGLAAMRSNPTMEPTPRYLVMNIVLSLLASVAGALVTARVAAQNASGHLLALSAVVVVMSVVSGFTTRDARQPVWYKFAIPVVGLSGVGIGWMIVA